MKASDQQIGGDHYKGMGDFQPWDVMRHWLTEEEYRGYQKGTAIAYLARERGKGGDADISKAAHHLAKLVEVIAEANAEKMPVTVDPNPFRAQRHDPNLVYDRDQDRWTTCK